MLGMIEFTVNNSCVGTIHMKWRH